MKTQYEVKWKGSLDLQWVSGKDLLPQWKNEIDNYTLSIPATTTKDPQRPLIIQSSSVQSETKYPDSTPDSTPSIPAFTLSLHH